MLNRLGQGITLVALLAVPAAARQHREAAGAPRQNAKAELHGGAGLPHPNHLNGGYVRQTQRRWQGGHWYHGLHDGRLGWWWTVGPDWFLFDSPVYPFPQAYGPPGTEAGWWYWCDPRQEYFPYVTHCPAGWRRLTPR